MTPPRTRVLVVDDSAIVRKLLAEALRADPAIEVVGCAADPFIARDLILQHHPDVLTLDIEMPRMDGLTFLRRLMAHHPLPVIVVSSLTQSGSAASIEALRAGAVDVIPKPGGPYSVGEVGEKLRRRIRGLRGAQVKLAPPAAAESRAPAAPLAGHRAAGLILIGASTGGTQAIEAILTHMPADAPPIAIVQHMPANFTRAFAERLDRVCAIRVCEARGGEVLERGHAYLAPGDYHMLIEREGVRVRTALRQGPPVHYQRPAVDVLFHSAAALHGVPMAAALLTGMGSDGADGLLALRQAGATTIAEDERSCVVFGMPREAIARGAAMHVVPLFRIPAALFDALAAQPPVASRATVAGRAQVPGG
jgi:two-component system chemotaxis response regulator CheB